MEMFTESRFPECHARYRGKVRGYVLSMVPDREDAEDSTRDVFEHIWRCRERIRKATLHGLVRHGRAEHGGGSSVPPLREKGPDGHARMPRGAVRTQRGRGRLSSQGAPRHAWEDGGTPVRETAPGVSPAFLRGNAACVHRRQARRARTHRGRTSAGCVRGGARGSGKGVRVQGGMKDAGRSAFDNLYAISPFRHAKGKGKGLFPDGRNRVGRLKQARTRPFMDTFFQVSRPFFTFFHQKGGFFEAERKGNRLRKHFFSRHDGRKTCACRREERLGTAARPAADAVFSSIRGGKAGGFRLSFCKAERLRAYAVPSGLRRESSRGFHYDSGIRSRLSSCRFPAVRESRICGGLPGGARRGGPRAAGFDFLTFCARRIARPGGKPRPLLPPDLHRRRICPSSKKSRNSR